MRRLLVLFALCLPLTAAPAQALEALALYDNFGGGAIDPARWFGPPLAW